jgi:hypothetical protein
MIVKFRGDGSAVPYGAKESSKIVRLLRERIGLPSIFSSTLAATTA